MGGRGEPTSQNRMKKTISYSKKHPFQSICCCRLLFRCSDKNQDRPRECNKKEGIILADLMHNRFVIAENTRAQFTYKVIKHLCLRVLNNDNTVVHKVCK